jgi:hypothetical protein
MLSKLIRIPATAPQPASLILAKIADAARALRLPSHSLYYAYGQERAADLRERIDAVDAALQQVQREADEAAVRLMSLDAPERVVFSSFTELIGADKNGR